MIEENEILKSQIRHKERDLAILNDKVIKQIGEIENCERENRNLQKEINDFKYMNESGERSKSEIHLKLKETEKRLYDMHHEKQEVEAKLRALQK